MENFKDYKTNIKEIVFSDEEERSFCDIFVYEPENIEEKSLGNLYIIGEVVNLPENSSYIVNLLASIIKKEFYSNKKRTTLESLEASLNKVNSTLSDLAEQGNVAWIGNLNMTCAAHRNKELQLSQTGKIKTLLIRNGKIRDIGKNVTSDEKPHPFRTFANMASGELEVGDVVLFATPGLFNVLSTEKIRQMSSLGDFTEFSNSIQETIAKENNVSTIAALLVGMESAREEARIPQVRIMTEDLPEKTITAIHETVNEGNTATEVMTAEEFNETGGSEYPDKPEKISLENIIKEFEEKERTPQETGPRSEANESEPAPWRAKIGQTENNESYAPTPHIEAEDPEKRAPSPKNDHARNIETMPKTVSGSATSISEKVKTSFSKITSAGMPFLYKLRFKKPQIDITQKMRIVRNSKIVFSAIVFIFIVLLGNVVITNYNNQIEAEKQKYADRLEQAKTKIDDAEVALINDPEKARQTLLEARVIATEIKDGYANLSADANSLLADIQVQIDKIDKVFRIDSPLVAMDLSKNEKILNISTLTKFKGNYFTINQDNSVFKLDLASGKEEEVQLSIKNAGDSGKTKLATVIPKSGEIVFITESSKVLTFDAKRSELKSQNIELNQDLSDITAIASYNSFIYLLEPGANQVFKHRETADGFGAGTKWMNEKTAIDIRNATSMAIDSTIFLLRSNGQVEEYLTGNKIKFSVDELKDPATNPTIIFTETGLKNLYVADPQKNRIIVFDKEKGTLLKQFIVKNFNFDIKDMTADDKEEALFVLSGTNIFKLDPASETN
ncbi:MAG: hypothetical protein WC788_06020 [Candidatus Paceibacterota bacterium]|jgi:hypothetical protein